MVIQFMLNVESVMTLISSLSNDDVIVIKHVELINGSRRTSGNASPLMVNLLFLFYRKTLVFYVPKC